RRASDNMHEEGTLRQPSLCMSVLSGKDLRVREELARAQHRRNDVFTGDACLQIGDEGLQSAVVGQTVQEALIDASHEVLVVLGATEDRRGYLPAPAASVQ